MKKHAFIPVFVLTFMLLVTQSACNTGIMSGIHKTSSANTESENNPPEDKDPPESLRGQTECSKDSVDEFISALNRAVSEGFIPGFTPDSAHCYNVTPDCLKSEADIKIFKFSDSYASFIFYGGKVSELCSSYGGYGFVNAVPCDFDADGNPDLLVASSWGSGMHRSVISVFNTVSGRSSVVFDTFGTDNPSCDLFIAAKGTDTGSGYTVYTVDIEASDSVGAALTYSSTGIYGSVKADNGVPFFLAE